MRGRTSPPLTSTRSVPYGEQMPPATFTAWMERLGLNTVEVAAALGCSRTTVQAYMAGRSKIPRYIALACAALAMGLPPHP